MHPFSAHERFRKPQSLKKGALEKNGLNLYYLMMDNEVLLLIWNISSDGTWKFLLYLETVSFFSKLAWKFYGIWQSYAFFVSFFASKVFTKSM